MNDWIERDATRVWHGFTQMATFALNEPVIVERAEGRELIDTRGPPLPRRHLLALGDDARPPRARARRGPDRAARQGRPLDDARQRQPGGGRALRGARSGRAAQRPALPLRLRRRLGGRAGAQVRRPVLAQHRPRPEGRLPRPERRLPRRHGRSPLARRGLPQRALRPASLPGAPLRAATPAPAGPRRPAAWSPPTPSGWPRS